MLTDIISSLKLEFLRMDEEIALFAEQLSLLCPPGCGACCHETTIEDSVLSCLPLALYVIETGRTDEILATIDQFPTQLCMFFKQSDDGAGCCQVYHYRPMICRVFGFAGRYDKGGETAFSPCKRLRIGRPDCPSIITRMHQTGESIPMLSDLAFRFNQINPDLARERFPLNIAIRKAIEKVGLALQLGA